MSLRAQSDRWSNYDAFQAAFSAYREASTEFDARILALVESGADTDAGLSALVADVEVKFRRFMDLSKPFVR